MAQATILMQALSYTRSDFQIEKLAQNEKQTRPYNQTCCWKSTLENTTRCLVLNTPNNNTPINLLLCFFLVELPCNA